MTRAATIAVCVVTLLAAGAASATAQTSASSGRIDVSVGALWMGRTPLASGDANEATAAGDPFRLFTTSTSLAAVTSGDLEVGFRFGTSLEVFGSGSYGKRQLRIAASDDRENAPPVTAVEALEQFTITGGAMWFFSQSKYAPFVRLEGGTLRQLHEGKALVESGNVFMAGAGVNIQLASRGHKPIGARLDGRVVVRSKNFLLNAEKMSPAVGLSIFMRF